MDGHRSREAKAKQATKPLTDLVPVGVRSVSRRDWLEAPTHQSDGGSDAGQAGVALIEIVSTNGMRATLEEMEQAHLTRKLR